MSAESGICPRNRAGHSASAYPLLANGAACRERVCWSGISQPVPPDEAYRRVVRRPVCKKCAEKLGGNTGNFLAMVQLGCMFIVLNNLCDWFQGLSQPFSDPSRDARMCTN
jgi:hypothetical protein